MSSVAARGGARSRFAACATQVAHDRRLRTHGAAIAWLDTPAHRNFRTGGSWMDSRSATNRRTEVWTRSSQFDLHSAAIDTLLDEVGAPLTATRRWWRVWLDAFPDVVPWTVARFDDAGELLALAPLGRRRLTGRNELLAIGDGVSDYACMPARTQQDAIGLADFLVDHLEQLRAPWSLALRQLPPGDAVAGRLAARLRFVRLQDAQPAPRTKITDRDLAAYLSRNYRKAARNRFSRLQRAGHEPEVEILRKPDAVEAELDEVVAICQTREREMAGRSHLDDPRREQFFRAITLALAEQGSLELSLLRADDAIIAYQLNFLDGSTYRTWNGHHDPSWSDFSPGHILDYRVLERVVNDEDFDEVDWMAGMESYKFRAATHTVGTQELLAWSSRMVGAAAFGSLLVRGRLEAAAEDDERAARCLEALRTVRGRVRKVTGTTRRGSGDTGRAPRTAGTRESSERSRP
jgi:CelD/BcsL family acetyltransferase involved in cellulose biosynthesis